MQQLLRFILGQLGYGHMRPVCDDAGNIFFGYFRFGDAALLLPGMFGILNLCGQRLFPIPQFCRLLKFLMIDGLLFFAFQLFQLFFFLSQVRRRDEHRNADFGCRLVHQVDCLIRQEPIHDIAA